MIKELPLEILTINDVIESGKIFIVGGPRPYLKIEVRTSDGREVGISLTDRDYRKLAKQFEANQLLTRAKSHV